jgi:predicted dehydrogenase
MVYCEWPLGRNLTEAELLATQAREKGIRTIIGLQGRFAAEIHTLKQLVASGFIGKPLGTSIRGCGPDSIWAGILEPAFEIAADVENGNTLLSIPAGHAFDMLTFSLGRPATVSATLVAARGVALRVSDNKTIPMTTEDQIAVTGTLENGALVSVHYNGGTMARPAFVWHVNGTEGNIVVSAEQGYANISKLRIQGARNGEPLSDLQSPSTDFSTLDQLSMNVARLYSQLASDIATGTSLTPSFDTAVINHRILHAIQRANATGTRQVVAGATT